MKPELISSAIKGIEEHLNGKTNTAFLFKQKNKFLDI